MSDIINPSSNATSIQGIPVSITPPTDGQVLAYVAANVDYEPTTVMTMAQMDKMILELSGAIITNLDETLLWNL